MNSRPGIDLAAIFLMLACARVASAQAARPDFGASTACAPSPSLRHLPQSALTHTDARTGPSVDGNVQVQFKSVAQGKQFEERFRNIGSQKRKHRLQIQIRRSAYRPPLEEREVNQQFYEHVQGIARRLEVKMASVHRQKPSDICQVPPHVPTLGGLGPVGGDVQTPQEYIVRDSLVDRAALLAMIIRLSATRFQ